MGAPSAAAMHVKSESEVTSVDAYSPPRSPRRTLYYVQSPSHDPEKMSCGSSPCGSPTRQFQYHCSPIHHSRESSTSRFSAYLNHKTAGRNVNPPQPWRRLSPPSDPDDGGRLRSPVKFYFLCFLFSFLVLFSIFSIILWAASTPYKPNVFVKSIRIEEFKVQAGMDGSGVQTEMVSLNSTVKMLYGNPATFFGVHVTSTPFQLSYYTLNIATGHMKKFYMARKSKRVMVTVVEGHQIPVYGAVPILDGGGTVSLPLNLTFVVRSRAYILGRLVKSKFYTHILCQVALSGNHVGKPINLATPGSCTYYH
ncbi:unnamed protein product [Cuscuta campestris]|uniref:Uncharacterized protein n=1 Tax=Cuscuta campestris TaxID=132261 RepID=A0A484LPJ2_9ASTE|nr:unnamed protein product [Cuscuta campestris]